MDIISVILFSILGYSLGSIPFGLILTKLVTGADIRKTGSGNIGATNVLRSGKKGLAALTLLLDGAKAWLAVYLALQFTESHVDTVLQEIYPSIAASSAGVAALVGHMFPIWLKFKGGKGVACYFGMLLGLSAPAFGIAVLIWGSMFAIKRISSLAALTATFFIPFWAYIFMDITAAAFVALCSLLIWWRHKENIGRLIRREEKPFGSKGEAST